MKMAYEGGLHCAHISFRACGWGSPACSQLAERVVDSRLLPTPSTEPPLPYSASHSASQPSGTCCLCPKVFSLTLSSEVSQKSSPPTSFWHNCLSLSWLIQTFPSVPHALCTQAWWLSLPTLCSFSYQAPCSVSLLILDGGTSLSDSLHSSQKESLFISQRRRLLLFDLPLTVPLQSAAEPFKE